MKITELKDLPIKVTQVTPLAYGEDDYGCALSCQAVVQEDVIELEPDAQGSFWGDDDAPTQLAKLMQGKEIGLTLEEATVSVATSNGDALFETDQAHKIKIGKAEPAKNREIKWSFSVSFRNTQENLYAAQRLMKRDDLTITVED